LYDLSNRLAAEDIDHFTVHAKACDLVHVFRRADTAEAVGFQFWLTRPVGLPRSHAIIGGKLRMVPEFRNYGLHLLSGLVFFLQNKLHHPRTRFYRLSIASALGFISITEALTEYHVFDPSQRTGEAGAIRETLVANAEASHFQLDEETGLFFVGIHMTPETLSRYPADFWERPAARVYAALNPEFRTNGSYAAFWFRFTPRNIAALTRKITRKLGLVASRS
jgi:hypothetical protein